MKFGIIFSTYILLFNLSCLAQPDNCTIEKDVREHFNICSKAVGAASYDIKKIKVIEIIKYYNDTFIAEISVKGTVKNYTIANDKKKKFSKKILFKYFLNSKKEWEYITENDPRKRMKP